MIEPRLAPEKKPAAKVFVFSQKISIYLFFFHSIPYVSVSSSLVGDFLHKS